MHTHYRGPNISTLRRAGTTLHHKDRRGKVMSVFRGSGLRSVGSGASFTNLRYRELFWVVCACNTAHVHAHAC